MNIGDSQVFNYTGGMQEFTVADSGLYKLEVWGAQGGGNGSGTYGTRGGDATHIATVTGTLRAIGKTNFDQYGLLVGAGGGGASYGLVGGNGGDYTGSNGSYTGSGGNFGRGGRGGTQNSGGESYYYRDRDGDTISISAGSFGAGSNGQSSYGGSGGGGGSGYYGASAGGSAGGSASGGGGSSWVGGVPPIQFKGVTYPPNTVSGQRTGNGLAKITYISKGFPEIYLGEVPISDALIGEIGIANIYVGDTPL